LRPGTCCATVPAGQRHVPGHEIVRLLILDSESEYDLTGANGKKQFRDMLAGAG